MPLEHLGRFFAQRLFWGTLIAAIGTLIAGRVVEARWFDDPLAPFALAFFAAGLAGLTSSWFLARAPEPRMAPPAARLGIRQRLRLPLRDRDFRPVVIFVAAWTATSNLAAPFITVYLLRQLGLPLGTVTALWVVSQAANALTLYLWGRLSDRLSNKAILAVALPVYFASTVALVFSDLRDEPTLRVVFLAALHVLMGAASGGIGLAVGNLGLKLAPRGEATAYLAVIALVTALAGGLAPLLAGAVGEWFAPRELTMLVRWVSPQHQGEVPLFALAHWEFLFAFSAAAGLYVLHALSRINEGDEVSERRVIQEFGVEAMRSSINQLSSIAGLLDTLFPLGRLLDRRKTSRRAPLPPAVPGPDRSAPPGAGNE